MVNMRPFVTIEALGFEAVPWSVPRFGRTKKGQTFWSRAKKTNRTSGELSLADWKEHVKRCAAEAMTDKEIQSGPLQVHFAFYGVTPPGHRHGELWDVGLVFKKKEKRWSKKNRNGKPEADMTNLVKGTEDALEGVVYANDCKNRLISCAPLYGPRPGVKIYISVIEPDDFPGDGDPV